MRYSWIKDKQAMRRWVVGLKANLERAKVTGEHLADSVIYDQDSLYNLGQMLFGRKTAPRTDKLLIEEVRSLLQQSEGWVTPLTLRLLVYNLSEDGYWKRTSLVGEVVNAIFSQESQALTCPKEARAVWEEVERWVLSGDAERQHYFFINLFRSCRPEHKDTERLADHYDEMLCCFLTALHALPVPAFGSTPLCSQISPLMRLVYYQAMIQDNFSRQILAKIERFTRAQSFWIVPGQLELCEPNPVLQLLKWQVPAEDQIITRFYWGLHLNELTRVGFGDLEALRLT